ncbi:MAG: hypothetical protein KDD64_05255 [Bdellovibrionales bacterium]|nr:hypothetical protein [Bdellovibrionales bacterium]
MEIYSRDSREVELEDWDDLARLEGLLSKAPRDGDLFFVIPVDRQFETEFSDVERLVWTARVELCEARVPEVEKGMCASPVSLKTARMYLQEKRAGTLHQEWCSGLESEQFPPRDGDVLPFEG